MFMLYNSNYNVSYNESYNKNHCASEFNSIQVCPGQKLMSVTYPLANPSLKTSHQEMLLEHTGVMEYTVIAEKGCHCSSDINITAAGREIEMDCYFIS